MFADGTQCRSTCNLLIKMTTKIHWHKNETYVPVVPSVVASPSSDLQVSYLGHLDDLNVREESLLWQLESLFRKLVYWVCHIDILVGWLVVLRINVDLAIFQPYLDLEAGDNQSLKNKVARRGIEPRSSCSCRYLKELSRVNTTYDPVFNLRFWRIWG